jgi:hypothetical protein
VEIFATAEYTDPAGKAYRIQAGIPIRIYGPLHLTKLVYDNNMSVGSLNTVSLILRYKPYSAIRIDPPVDSSGPNFLMTTPSYKEGASSCDGAFCYRTYSYSIRAERPGSHNLPAARASYTLGNMTYYESSESPKVYVFGPYIDAYGSVSSDKNDSGNRNASITLKNTGNKNAYDLVLEYDAPHGTGVARREPAATRLEPNSNKTMIIPLKCQKGGECDIPSLRIEYRYFDINPLNKTFQSGSVGVRLGNQAPFSPPVPERKETATVGHEGIAQGNIENILNGFINNILNIKIRF